MSTLRLQGGDWNLDYPSGVLCEGEGFIKIQMVFISGAGLVALNSNPVVVLPYNRGGRNSCFNLKFAGGGGHFFDIPSSSESS